MKIIFNKLSIITDDFKSLFYVSIEVLNKYFPVLFNRNCIFIVRYDIVAMLNPWYLIVFQAEVKSIVSRIRNAGMGSNLGNFKQPTEGTIRKRRGH